MKNKEKAVLTNEALRVNQEKHALSDVPPFDPEADRAISQEEQIYYISYYDELAKGINLEPAYAKMVKDLYIRTNNPALQQIATQL